MFLHGQGFIISVLLTLVYKIKNRGNRESSKLLLYVSPAALVRVWLAEWVLQLVSWSGNSVASFEIRKRISCKEKLEIRFQ
jgi:hypothetical protein